LIPGLLTKLLDYRDALIFLLLAGAMFLLANARKMLACACLSCNPCESQLHAGISIRTVLDGRSRSTIVGSMESMLLGRIDATISVSVEVLGGTNPIAPLANKKGDMLLLASSDWWSFARRIEYW